MSNPVKFKVGDTAPDGNRIKSIYGATDTILVFSSENDAICHYIDIDEIPPKTASALQEYERLRALIYHVYPKKDWFTCQDQLGISFFNSLTASDEAKAVASFAPLNERILKKSGNAARIQYASAATGSAAVLTLLAYLFYEFYWVTELRVYGACAMFAALGAFASVILRIPSIPVDPLEDKWVVLYQGAFRIVVGVLFAVFLVAAAKANLIAGIATATTATLLTYSFLCGFSERFAPELLASLEKVVAGTKGTSAK